MQPDASHIGDHPRIRGNSLSLFSLHLYITGSPPHTREQLGCRYSRDPPSRITPAYAGTASLEALSASADEDHPRIRGNSSANCCCRAANRGSPPHTREQHGDITKVDARTRITPAYAGTAALPPGQNGTGGDHPRIRGNSSGAQLGQYSTTWITPAYAGTAFFSSCDVFFCKDHPRIRGNSSYRCEDPFLFPGSPPHTREQLSEQGGMMGAVGITPAYAGTARRGGGKDPAIQDHPRIRGNSLNHAGVTLAGIGSPPHTREQSSE